VKLSKDTVQKHTKALKKEDQAQSTGKGQATRYFALVPQGPSVSVSPEIDGFEAVPDRAR
jgi:hypothetical protein